MGHHIRVLTIFALLAALDGMCLGYAYAKGDLFTMCLAAAGVGFNAALILAALSQEDVEEATAPATTEEDEYWRSILRRSKAPRRPGGVQ